MGKRVLVILALSVLFVGAPMQASSEAAGFKVEASDTVLSVLERHVGERLYVQTKGGKEINGVLKLVGNSVIHIASVSGRDFYDAVIAIDSIESVMVRARGN